ncbi:hypothetical protein [Glycomyces harbinensis]|uniref:Uncharacterized protein n=1 Tax=Glycomyces harbinensis TaxID=58114 RepID=A0A1G7B2J5_9ACTN|nr:hypothetical protein [Glycomyces harbinensis]SDE21319.1 hypothetical protein SAMN05216270_115112 [Glycomyces harbinensis]
MSGREYDLREDARALVVGQWLREGEQLRTFAPTGRGNYKSEIRGFPSAAWKAATVLGWSAAKIASPAGIVTGGVPYWNEIRRFEGRPPGLVAFGDGRSCEAAKVLGTGPHRSGIWVLSRDRFGFAADRRVSPGPGLAPGALKREDAVILLDKVIDIPSARFAFEGDVTRGDAVYLRIRFHDGSGVDVHNR